MLSAYYKPRKCVHLRYCLLELILQIILFLGGMLALQVAICFLFGVKMMSDILAIYHRELFPNTSCLLTIGSHLCVVEFVDHLYFGFCFSFSLAKVCVNSRCLPYHLWILFISCSCLVFSRYSESSDPTLCILYSNANPI